MQGYRTEHIQATSINLTNFNIVISAIYCPPRHNIKSEQFLDFFSTLGSKFVAAGDYNAKHTFWGSRITLPKGKQLLNAICHAKLDVISTGQPTYWPSDFSKTPDLIDFAVVKNIKRDQMSIYPTFDLSSDHSPTIMTLFNVCENEGQNFPNKRTNWMKYKKYVSSHIPQYISLRTADEIDSAVNQFTDILNKAAEVSTPKSIGKTNKPSYCPRDIEALIREKRSLRRDWQRYRSPAIKSRLKYCQKRLTAALKANEESTLKCYLQNLSPTERTDYNLWKATKDMRSPIEHESPVRLQNGSWAKSTDEKVNAFANHLEEAFTPNSGSSAVCLPEIDEVVPRPFRLRLKTIEDSVKDLATKKSAGRDRITPKMIRELPHSALKMVLFIFNSILRTGYFPTSWKRSEIVMIPKPGKDLTQVKSYRPISLLPILSKMFEKILLLKITPYISSNGVIPDHQFGFRKCHSTIEQVHRIVTVIRNAFENKQYCSALFIDISQAFDKVWHDGLVYKITRLLPSNTHKLLKSYLTDRSFEVRSKGTFSNSKKITAGVPQGSILGPILYIIYTADMPTSSLTHTCTFADDTAFISVHKNALVASYQLQSHVRELENWLLKWRIMVNAAKCTHVTFTLRRDTCPPITIFNKNIPQKTHVKYLGIHIDRRLTWAYHIDSKVTQIKLKLIQLIWLIGPRSTLDLEYKVLIYKAIIKPIWTYGIQLWGSACASNVNKLQRRQSNILRLITGAPWYIRNANIHKDLNMPLVKEEIQKNCRSYASKLSTHPNTLARELLNHEGRRRLRRRYAPDLS